MGVLVTNPNIGATTQTPDTAVIADTPDTSGSVAGGTGGVSIPTGLPGADGTATVEPFEYQMLIPATTVIIDHDLGRDPIAIQVLLDGEQCSEYLVVMTQPATQVTIGFDIAVAALIRLF